MYILNFKIYIYISIYHVINSTILIYFFWKKKMFFHQHHYTWIVCDGWQNAVSLHRWIDVVVPLFAATMACCLLAAGKSFALSHIVSPAAADAAASFSSAPFRRSENIEYMTRKKTNDTNTARHTSICADRMADRSFDGGVEVVVDENCRNRCCCCCCCRAKNTLILLAKA